jgi:putative flippase GtrA
MFFEFIRYNLVGVINSVAGFSIIYILMFFGVTPTMSNAIGYSIGSIISYYLNRKYTFKSALKSKIVMFKFFLVLAISYGLNLLTLKYLITIINPYLAQIGSAIIYTLSSFLLIKFTVFNIRSNKKKLYKSTNRSQKPI